MPVSEETYRRVALEADDETWELHCGRLVAKPAMSLWHNRLGFNLAVFLDRRLSKRGYEVRFNSARTARDGSRYYVPDCVVIPRSLSAALAGTDLELYDQPLPLVIEVWSPSTGGYDVDEKLPEYQRRGDLEIWRIHPFERTLTTWRRQEDGTYASAEYRSGDVRLHAIPSVTVNLDQLWASLD